MEHTIKTLLAQGKSQRRIAQDLGISRKVVRRIKQQLDDQLPSKGYERAKQLEGYASQVDSYLEQDWSAVLIHQKLKEKHGLQVSYATVRRFIAERKGQEVFVPMHCAAGEEGQVDFGYLGRFMQEDGREVKVWVFCMVLSHSRYGYYEVVTDQRVETFLRCHIHAFEYFRGVPDWVLLDNLKAGVLQPDFYEPLLQEQYSELLSHYGCAGKPCRVRTPQHKGKVESGVKYVKNNFAKGLEHCSFERLRADLKQWNEQVCNRRLHGTTRKIPLEVFEQSERAALLPLPAHRYELYQWEERKVNRLGHITFQQNYYSVPYTLVGKTLCVKSNGLLVKIYANQQEVALHQQADGKGTYITRTEHLPPYKQPKTEEAYRADMAQIGEQAVAFLEALIQHNRHWKEKVQGILSLRKSYSDAYIDQACGRALDFGAYSYQTVKNICQSQVLQQQPPVEALPADLGGFTHNLALYDQLAAP